MIAIVALQMATSVSAGEREPIPEKARIAYAERRDDEARRIVKAAASRCGMRDRDKCLDLWLMATNLATRAYDLNEAERAARTAMSIADRALGRHADTARAYGALGVVLDIAGRTGEAEVAIRQGWAIRKAIFGERHMTTLVSVDNIALNLYRQGRNAEAEAWFRFAVEATADPMEKARRLSNMAASYQDSGRSAEAEAASREAMRLLKSADGWRGQPQVMVAVVLGSILVDRGQLVEARDVLEPALRAAQRSLPSVPDTRPAFLLLEGGLARSLLDIPERLAEARTRFRRAEILIFETMATYRDFGAVAQAELMRNRHVFAGHVAASWALTQSTTRQRGGARSRLSVRNRPWPHGLICITI